jgi:hypothetical protein
MKRKAHIETDKARLIATFVMLLIAGIAFILQWIFDSYL